MMSNLPPEFVLTVLNTFQGEGKHWLKKFPELLKEAARRWNLTDIQPVPHLSYNFVAFVKSYPPLAHLPTGDGNLVLKLGVPQRELTSEIAALKFYNGYGACRLLDADAEKGMLLLERLQPGRMLATVTDDEHAIRTAAEVMLNLWKSGSDFSRFVTAKVAATPFIYLKDWFDGFKRLRNRYNGETGRIPEHLVETAESLSRDLLAENKEETLLHGDFHHFNVLESERGWLAIDPKGVVGPKGYEVGPLLINPVPDFLNGSNPRACPEQSQRVQTEKRIAILSEMLALERERVRSWALCHAVLSAWWSIEDNASGWGEYSLRCAEIFTQVRV